MEDTEDIKYKCPDMCVNDVTITINDVGAVSVEGTMLGTGRQIMGAMAALPDSADESYVLGSDALVNFGPVGAPASMVGRHMSTTLKLDNQLVVHKAPGGGQYGIFVRKGNPKFSISTTIAVKDADDIYTLHRNDTACSYALTANSGASAQLGITIPQMHSKTTKLGFDGEMEIWQIEADETTCYRVAGVQALKVSSGRVVTRSRAQDAPSFFQGLAPLRRAEASPHSAILKLYRVLHPAEHHKIQSNERRTPYVCNRTRNAPRHRDRRARKAVSAHHCPHPEKDVDALLRRCGLHL
jgi:hypothetical protein